MKHLFKKYSLGIDISELSLKLVQLEDNEEKPKLISVNETELQKDAILQGELKNEQGLVNALKKLISSVKGQKIKSNKVVISLPEEKSFIDILKMPLLSNEELEKAVCFEASNRLPLPIEETCFGFEVVARNNHLDVLIAACPEKVVIPYLNACKKVGLSPIAFEIECQAIARCFTKSRVFYKPFLIIDFGENRTSFMIYSGISLRFTSTISVSSGAFTEAIVQQFKLTQQKAEALKIKEGLLGKKDVLKAVKPLLDDLVAQTNHHLDYYRSFNQKLNQQKNGAHLEQIVLCGGGANLKGLSEFLTKELAMPVKLADIWLNIEKDKISQGLVKNNSLGLATAVGLALRNFKQYGN